MAAKKNTDKKEFSLVSQVQSADELEIKKGKYDP